MDNDDSLVSPLSSFKTNSPNNSSVTSESDDDFLSDAPARHQAVRSRNEAFVAKTATRIWSEQPTPANPYIAQAAQCYGYDLVELMHKRSFVDVFYLLLRGNLPDPESAQLLEALMIALINPGPRHPATRAGMNAAIGKTDPLHILPIASGVMSGEHQGAGLVEAAMRFLRKQLATDPVATANQLLAEPELNAPGFGQIYGGLDELSAALAAHLVSLKGAGRALLWGQAFHQALAPNNLGWLNYGLAAAVFCDLGFQPRAGGCLMQLLSAPGLVAHGLEMANKPITAMPFVKDENYVIET
jgi:citrate synthase